MLNRIKQSDFYTSLQEVVYTNSNLLVAFTAVLILVSGISVIDNHSRWWVPVLSLIALMTTVFMFMNFRVVIKGTVSVVMAAMLSSFAFTGGSLADPYGLGGVVWMGLVWALLFACLAWSYARQSGRSRWAVVMVTQMTSFLVSYSLVLSSVSVAISSVIGAVVGLFMFIVVYSVMGRNHFRAKNVPSNSMDDKLAETLVDSADFIGWNSALMPEKDDKGSVLVWNEDHAYMIHPVLMSSPFGTIGRKSQRLSYNRKSITPWLNHLVYNKVPVWRSRGADITVILLDLNRRNGDKIRVISQPVPDSKKVIPVVVAPVSRVRKPNKIAAILQNVDKMLADSKRILSYSQLKALSGIGDTGEEKKEDTDGPDLESTDVDTDTSSTITKDAESRKKDDVNTSNKEDDNKNNSSNNKQK
jgi:membrane protein